MSLHCTTGKRCYDSVTLAKEGLIHVRAAREFLPGEGPQGIYQCALCGCYHLTSAPEAEFGLEEEDKKRIDKEKEARHWEDKFRKK